MRLRKWLDPRLLIGLGLVVVSVASVVFIVNASNRTVEAWAVSDDVVPGDVLQAEDVVLARVQLDRAHELYHLRDESPIGLVATRSMATGELVPRSAVTDAAVAARSRVVVQVDGPLSDGVARGETVDVWASVPLERSEMSTPEVIVDDAIVAAVHADEGLMVSSRGLQVELLVPAENTAEILHAVASSHALHIVPDPAGADAP